MTAPLAQHLNLNELLPSDVKVRSLSTGDVLLAAGDMPAAIWVVRSGVVRSLCQQPPQNQWRTVERYESGSWLGWLDWLLN